MLPRLALCLKPPNTISTETGMPLPVWLASAGSSRLGPSQRLKAVPISHTPKRVTREALANVVITKQKGQRVAERSQTDRKSNRMCLCDKPSRTFRVFSEDITAEQRSNLSCRGRSFWQRVVRSDAVVLALRLPSCVNLVKLPNSTGP